MIKKIHMCLFLHFILSTQSLFPSNIKSMMTTESLTELAEQLEPHNTTKIKDYAWTAADDYTYTPPIINRTEKIIVATILDKMSRHKDCHTFLSAVVSNEDALTIKEGFFNILLNSRCIEDEAMKQGYDAFYGPGRFYETHGNYKKSEKFNPAYNFAKKIWPDHNDNMITIQQLINETENSIEDTGAAWIAIQEKLDEDCHVAAETRLNAFEKGHK